MFSGSGRLGTANNGLGVLTGGDKAVDNTPI